MRSNESILSNWAVLIDDFNTSGQDFFEATQRNVEARDVPEVKFKRVLYRESGLLSSKREYLRMSRGNVVFDLSAAPYGTGFFFSWWLAESRTRFAWIYTLGFLSLFGLIGAIAWESIGNEDLGPIAIGIGAPLISFFIFGIAGKIGLLGPEQHVAQSPLLLGWLYRRVFSPDTYHSLDVAAAFQESIRRAVNDAVDEALKGGEKDVLSEAQKQFKSSLGVAQATVSKL